ncbi:MAG: hypothetical protein P1V35_16715 [Planctomycetota bacterium]|nr:hypothetical protein [Planctomycetota bacterium]
MTTSELFTLLLKFLGVATIFWAAKQLVVQVLVNEPMYANANSTTLLIVELVSGATLIFMAPLITSTMYGEGESA